MVKVIVLFNLKSEASREDYEAWARDRDVPTVTGFGSVDDFRVFRTTGLLGSTEPAPYQYVELIEVNDMDAFQQDVGSAVMQEVGAEFQGFAESITFMLAERSA